MKLKLLTIYYMNNESFWPDQVVFERQHFIASGYHPTDRNVKMSGKRLSPTHIVYSGVFLWPSVRVITNSKLKQQTAECNLRLWLVALVLTTGKINIHDAIKAPLLRFHIPWKHLAVYNQPSLESDNHFKLLSTLVSTHFTSMDRFINNVVRPWNAQIISKK